MSLTFFIHVSIVNITIINFKDMDKIKSLADLKKKRDELKASISLREDGDNADQMVQIKVAMSTCGIASGAKPVMDTLIETCNSLNIRAVVTQTGCMGYCYAEPTVEITKPGQEPIVFGYVTVEKAKSLVEKYIVNNEILEGVIPPSYQSIDD
jgi:NADP-reducing hydrogenase subunit HndB